MQQGHQVEEYARRVAGGFGVADFVYRPVVTVSGSRSREISDGLLVAGSDGLILQVKSRDRSPGVVDSPERALAWCRKHGAIAQSQGRGTRRALSAGNVRVQSLRGHGRTLPAVTGWPIVVLIDHPLNPTIELDTGGDTVFISMGDWLNLHGMIRSTAGVIDYVNRVLASGVKTALGHEEQRFALFASADAEVVNAGASSVPFLTQSLLAPEEEFAAALFSDLIEKVAEEVGSTVSAEDYILIIEQLDRYPLLSRVRIGAKIVATLKAAVESQSRRSFILAFGDPPRRLGVLCDYHRPADHGAEGERFAADVGMYGILRQTHALEAGASSDSCTLAVGILHSPNVGRKYFFSLFTHPIPSIPGDIRAFLERDYGVFTGSAVVGPTPA